MAELFLQRNLLGNEKVDTNVDDEEIHDGNSIQEQNILHDGYLHEDTS